MKYDKLKPPTDHYQVITDKIIEQIESGPGEYATPWRRTRSDIWRPVNIESKKPYRGSNRLNLAIMSEIAGRSAGVWGTFNQWKAKGEIVRKGEKASYVCFYQPRDAAAPQPEASTEGEQSERSGVIVKWYAVFSAEQVDGLEAPSPALPESVVSPLERAEAFMAATGAKITHEGERAFYRPSSDEIYLPRRALFTGTETSTPQEAYYSTALHELTHWTGAEKRCNRALKTSRFGTEAYAFEELVADIGAAFLCADTGVALTPRADHAQYIASWLKIMKGDKKAIFHAAAEAERAATFLAGLQPKPGPEPTRPEDEGGQRTVAIAISPEP